MINIKIPGIETIQSEARFEEKVKIWQRQVEDMVLEIEGMHTMTGLLIMSPSCEGLVKELTSYISESRERLQYANRNPGGAVLVHVPGADR